MLFDKSGVVTLGCNIHDQMVGWVLVVDTPYYTKRIIKPFVSSCWFSEGVKIVIK